LNFQKTNIGSYLGSKIEEEEKNFLDLAKKFFSSRTTRKNRSSPNNGPIKIFFCKILIF
jgi:hypothetical protein